jgi:solute carrier family 9 (sodium/hydrogen exchanger), member 8
MSSLSNNEKGITIYFVMFSFLLAVVLIVSNILHKRPSLAALIPEAGMILLIGMLSGTLVMLVLRPQMNDDSAIEKILSFSPEVFFMALLPPIIFNSGYHLRSEIFLRHFKPICLFACLGTLISTIVIGLVLKTVVALNLTGDFKLTWAELFTFGALLSATDPVSTLAIFQSKKVDPHLFYLVFGESVINDAVGLALFNSFSKFIQPKNGVDQVAAGVLNLFLEFTVDFLGSSILGCLAGLLAAGLLKLNDIRQSPLQELSLYVLIIYVPYLFADILELSGIVTILFTGIAAQRYCIPNLSLATQNNADILFRLAAHIAETSIFLEMGLSAYSTFALGGYFQWHFFLWAILACLLGRAVNVYPITFFFNKFLASQSSIRKKSHNGKDEMNNELSLIDEGDKEQFNGSDFKIDEQSIHMGHGAIKIEWKTAHMLWYSGLRGAVAYACVRSFPNTFNHRTELVAVTMAIILLTVFLFGSTTECFLYLLKIPTNVDEDTYMACSQNVQTISSSFQKFEESYIQRLVIRDFYPVNTSIRLNLASSEELQSKYQHQNAVSHGEFSLTNQQEYKRKESLYDYGFHEPNND